jgi:integrase
MTARPKTENTWMADFMVGGTRYREFGFPSKASAEAWELSARSALKMGLPVPAPSLTQAKETTFTIMDLVRYCARHHWSGKKASENLIRNAELFAKFVGADTPASQALRQQEVDDYVAHLRDETECAGSTINRRLSSVSVMIDYADRLNRLEGRAPRLSWQKEGEHRFRWFTEAEAKAIFDTLRSWGLNDMAALFEFLCDTGCRVGEALKLEARDLQAGRATFWDTKNGKSRTVPLTKRALAAASRPGLKPFGDITRHDIRFAWAKLRAHYPWLKDAVVHTFRHTCASWLVQRGIDLMRVKEWMGHAAIATTLRYAKLSPKHLDELVLALEKT